MKRERVFENIRLFDESTSLYKVVGNPEKTILAWNNLLRKELKQDICFFPPFNRNFKRSDIRVRWVVGDVLCIQTSMEKTLMYINIASFDTLLCRMRDRPGKEFKTFLDAIRKNHYTAYGAAILIMGFLQRDHTKKKLYEARTAWRKLLRFLPKIERSETLTAILNDIPDSPAKRELLSWHKRYFRDYARGKEKSKYG